MTELIFGGHGVSDAEVENMIGDALVGMSRMDTYTAVTNGSGDAIFNFSSAFISISFIGFQMVSPANTRIRGAITIESLSGCTIRVEQPGSATVALVGLVLLASTVAVSGQTVKIIVIGD